MGGIHKTVLEMLSGNYVTCGLRHFSILQVIEQEYGEYPYEVIENINLLDPLSRYCVTFHHTNMDI